MNDSFEPEALSDLHRDEALSDEELRLLRALLLSPTPPFTVEARAWMVGLLLRLDAAEDALDRATEALLIEKLRLGEPAPTPEPAS